VAINATGTSYGADQTFRTANRPKPGLSLAVKSAKAKVLPYRYTLSGQLKLTDGVTKAQGCSGTVAISIKSGSKRIATHRVAVNQKCSDSSQFNFSARLGSKTSGKLSASAKYLGNSALAATGSKKVTVHYG
jgi:hypothetical protein